MIAALRDARRRFDGLPFSSADADIRSTISKVANRCRHRVPALQSRSSAPQ
ncbi:hypothetical protein OF829_12010 [Sphingomonas sp. LB-2]|uniref:hypothetical protein n=1 Tax=Sphingomonas caeni TaxID=2984949 RepID=UPI00222F10DA|nr:hypothetical protein [Sphingomonas caeni]MCW3847964.1 hypothetical protein [Sphingomonas caeni]